MRVHSKDKLKQLKILRRKGFSINEIVALLNIPRTTVWHHIQGVSVDKKYVKLLKSKRGGSAKIKESNIILAKEKAHNLLQGGDREFALIFAMLHWAEGSKKVCEFINSDGRMIKLYLNILRNKLLVSENDIVPTMRIFTGMNKKECLSYWSYVTSIPKNRFKIRLNDGGISSKSRYGMCRITIRKGQKILKIIHALINEILLENKIQS